MELEILDMVDVDVPCRAGLGNDYNNEFVWIMHFTPEGKIDRARAYYDSAHMEGLAREMKMKKKEEEEEEEERGWAVK